jgi:signal transduction histidine kinase
MIDAATEVQASGGTPWLRGFAGLWRSSATRMILGYGALFTAWCIVLIGAISWETARYLENVIDQILQQRVHFLTQVERSRLPELLAATKALDLRGYMSYGLFDADNRYLLGDIDRLPPDLPIDGSVHPLPRGIDRVSGQRGNRSRGVAIRRPDDDLVLVLVRDYGNVDRLNSIIRGSLFWAMSLMLIPGLLGGFLLARGPLRRVRGIEAAIQPIMRGDLRARLPLSPRCDELDMLAAIVNRMLDQIEQLLGEVKGVSDSIAHDLRTPLTRLRTQLHRLQREQLAGADATVLLERCVGETDVLLDRFRALLRISELEDLHRRAGFRLVDLAEILRRAHELYAPLAEDKGIRFQLQADVVPPVQADPDLLFEAVTNLLSNAIKFTPSGGDVRLASNAGPEGPRIEVRDSGPGIAPGEREAVLQRFYRAQRTVQQGPQRSGFGLGLSIVAAIVKLHGFRLEIGSNEPGGSHMIIHCHPART